MRLFALLLLAGCAAAAPAPAARVETVESRAARLHAAAIVVDTHNDVTSAILDEGFDLGKPNGKTHTDLPRLRAGGLTAEFFAIYVDASFVGKGAARRALDMIDATYAQVERYPGDLVLATRAADIRKAKADGRVAVLMGIEGGHAIENSLGALRAFHKLGVRYMTLTHTNTNDWADSAGSGDGAEVRHHGLSPFGEEVVREMQRIGMLVDVSHVSDETFEDTLRVARAPVIASHSSMRALCDHPRNVSDDMLRALARNGGVVMVNFAAPFLDPKWLAAYRQFRAANKARLEAIDALEAREPARAADLLRAFRAELRAPRPPVSAIVDHIDHAVKIAGIDHVGLGSDFDGIPALPEGMDGVGDLPRITRLLVERGYTDEQVLKVLGKNFLRVLEAAERYAAATRTPGSP